MNHKYIIELLDFEVKNDKIYLLIEYAENGDLFSFIKHFSTMSFKNQMTMFYKIILSVKYLHDNSLVHRDIKPENIMITNTLRPKLADFGSTNAKREMSKTFCGTYEYMAPEIYRRGKQNEKVDIWALGVLLYEIT